MKFMNIWITGYFHCVYVCFMDECFMDECNLNVCKIYNEMSKVTQQLAHIQHIPGIKTHWNGKRVNKIQFVCHKLPLFYVLCLNDLW